MLHRERLLQLADQILGRKYEEYPELAAFAEEQGEIITSSMCDTFGSGTPLPRDAEETLRGAYKKLHFMFTDPHDHRDTPPHSILYALSEEVMSSRKERPPNMVVFADALKRLTCQLFMLRGLLQVRGELEDITPGNQLFYVKNRLDFLLALGTDDMQPDADPDNPTGA